MGCGVPRNASLSMTPTRETFGNIPNSSQLIFYCLTVVTMAAFHPVLNPLRQWPKSLLPGVWRQNVWPVCRTLTRQGIARLKFSGRKRYGVKTQTKLSLT